VLEKQMKEYVRSTVWVINDICIKEPPHCPIYLGKILQEKLTFFYHSDFTP
jgi:hypothetical protein